MGQYVVVQVVAGIPMMFGGSDAPCASAFFMSIGKIGPEENKVHAAAIYPLVTKHLNIPEDRMYILFNNAAYRCGLEEHNVCCHPWQINYFSFKTFLILPRVNS